MFRLVGTVTLFMVSFFFIWRTWKSQVAQRNPSLIPVRFGCFAGDGDETPIFYNEIGNLKPYIYIYMDKYRYIYK